MSSHATLAYVTAALIPLAALITCVYALFPRSRKRTRWLLITSNIVAVIAVAGAAGEGEMLLDDVTGTAPEARVEAANAHAHASASLFIATGIMLSIVLVTAWWVLRPGREASRGSRIASGLLIAAAAASLVALWLVVDAGISSTRIV